jgi:hypothetical protein
MGAFARAAVKLQDAAVQGELVVVADESVSSVVAFAAAAAGETPVAAQDEMQVVVAGE